MPPPLNQRPNPKIDGLVPRHVRETGPQVTGPRPRAPRVPGDTRPPLPEKPELISTSHGRLQDVLLTIPRYAVEPPAPGAHNPLGAIYRDLIEKLPSAVHFTVLTHGAALDRVRRWFRDAGADARATLIAAPDYLNFSVWAEDGYVVVHDARSNERYFVEPFEFPRYADSLIADMVANATAMQSTQAPLRFQGGNVLIGDDFFLIGADDPRKSLRYVPDVIDPSEGETPAVAVRRLYGALLDSSRELLYVGSTVPVPAEQERTIVVDGDEWTEVVFYGNEEGTVQPIFHLDMFITPAGRDAAGRRRVVVGDPRLAAKELGVPLWRHSMAGVFDDIARGLERRGFAVHRNPLPLVYVDDVVRRTRVWYFATANNALVEITSSSDRIWLPTYGHGPWSALEATDLANRRVWESLGFDVTELTDAHAIAEQLGAVHCIKKYLARG